MDGLSHAYMDVLAASPEKRIPASVCTQTLIIVNECSMM